MDDQEQGQDNSYNASSVGPVDLCEGVNYVFLRHWIGRLTYKEHSYKTDQCSYSRSPPCEKPGGHLVQALGTQNEFPEQSCLMENDGKELPRASAYLKVGLKFGALPIFRRKHAKLVTQNVIRYVIVTKLRRGVSFAISEYPTQPHPTRSIPGNRIDIHEQG